MDFEIDNNQLRHNFVITDPKINSGIILGIDWLSMCCCVVDYGQLILTSPYLYEPVELNMSINASRVRDVLVVGNYMLPPHSVSNVNTVVAIDDKLDNSITHFEFGEISDMKLGKKELTATNQVCGMNLVSLSDCQIPIRMVNKTNKFLPILSLTKIAKIQPIETDIIYNIHIQNPDDIVRQDIELYLETNPKQVKETKEIKDRKPKMDVLTKVNETADEKPDKFT